MYNGAVFFDVDGTIIDGWEGIFAPTEKTKAAVTALREKGYLTVMATGRSMGYLHKATRLFDGYVTSNGAYAEVAGEICASKKMDKNGVRELISYFQAHGVNYIIESQDKCYCGDLREKYFLNMIDIFNYDGQCFLPYEGRLDFDVYKLMATYDDMEKERMLQAAFGGIYDITDQPGNNASDIGQKDIDKGYGVKKVIEHFGIPRERTYAFGDADNDCGMLRAVGCGIAMGRHTQRLEQAASMITGTVREDGVFHALDKLGLI